MEDEVDTGAVEVDEFDTVGALDEVLQPDREPLEVLEQLRSTMGSPAFSAQYLQAPVPPGGNMFRRDWVRRYEKVPTSEPGDEIIQSWDTAQKRSRPARFDSDTVKPYFGSDPRSM